MKKHGVLALVLAGVMLLLCGCGGMTTDDAMDYVQSALDCGYKAEVKKYAEITETTEKEAKKEYETNLDTIMKEAGFDDTGVSDELKADYRSMFEKMLKSANYKVKEAKQAEEKKNEIVMYLAHDIRTPLTTVIGYLSLLHEAPDMPEQQKEKSVKVALNKAERSIRSIEINNIIIYDSQHIM